jgi:glycosyltransferase involved in cell wall biosynthesis
MVAPDHHRPRRLRAEQGPATTLAAVKLIIQIPCLNEEQQLPETLSHLPRTMPGFDEVEWLVIDDGSTDRTVEVALECGVDHVVRFPQNRGLAAAFQAGLDAALKLGADVVVNTDADNQYDAGGIVDLVGPIRDGRADVVIGDRGVAAHDEFSSTKKRLQRMGSWVVARAAGAAVPDATSGFRAYSRGAALELFVVNNFTYTLESVIQAGKRRRAVVSVPVGTNPKSRDSRLFRSMRDYVRRSALVIMRVFANYEPLKFFSWIALLLFGAGFLALLPWLVDWVVDGDRSGHVQSIIAAAVLFLAGGQVLVLGVVADLITSNRAVTQEVLERVRRVELAVEAEPHHVLVHPSRQD